MKLKRLEGLVGYKQEQEQSQKNACSIHTNSSGADSEPKTARAVHNDGKEMPPPFSDSPIPGMARQGSGVCSAEDDGSWII